MVDQPILYVLDDSGGSTTPIDLITLRSERTASTTTASNPEITASVNSVECCPEHCESQTIDNMKDNRVLNYQPPPNNDEETYLTRPQRATLSQLRSGHCKLLNSYKKRLTLQVVQTGNRSTGCSSLVQLHCSPHRFDT